MRYARLGAPNLPPIPLDIPRNPSAAYKNRGWINWAHWLGQPVLGLRFDSADCLPFEEARTFARSLKLNGQKEWRNYCSGKLKHSLSLPLGVPRGPEKVYAGKGWAGYPDWLGTTNVATKKIVYREFDPARMFVRSLNLQSRSQWSTFVASGQRPKDIPTNPAVAYRSKGWLDWSDWLGCPTTEAEPSRGSSRKTEWRDFHEALTFVHGLRIPSSTAWIHYAKGELLGYDPKPLDIPASPKAAYPHDWLDWGHWLGTNTKAPFERGFISYEEARLFARLLGFRTSIEWTAWASRESGLLPDNIPVSPQTAYKNKGWVSWSDFLGSGNVAPK